MALPDVAMLERAALNAVPAPKVAFDGPIVLRAFHGGTGRANAACSLSDAPDPALAARLKRLEAFYQRAGLKPRWRSTPLDPPGVLDLLAQQGFTERDSTSVMAGRPGLAQPDPDVTALEDGPDDDWHAVVATAEYQVAARQQEKREQLALLAMPSAWLVLRQEGKAAACGFVVADGSLAGFFDIAVRPENRRQGLAQRLMKAGAAWAAQKGAVFPWLQVSSENTGAQALYRTLGFVEAYRYTYWVKG